MTDPQKKKSARVRAEECESCLMTNVFAGVVGLVVAIAMAVGVVPAAMVVGAAALVLFGYYLVEERRKNRELGIIMTRLLQTLCDERERLVGASSRGDGEGDEEDDENENEDDVRAGEGADSEELRVAMSRERPSAYQDYMAVIDEGDSEEEEQEEEQEEQEQEEEEVGDGENEDDDQDEDAAENDETEDEDVVVDESCAKTAGWFDGDERSD